MIYVVRPIEYSVHMLIYLYCIKPFSDKLKIVKIEKYIQAVPIDDRILVAKYSSNPCGLRQLNFIYTYSTIHIQPPWVSTAPTRASPH